MTFTVKDWRDYPDTTTPISAAAIEDLETRVAAYADTRTPVFNVKDYGAVANGSTNDTAAAQAAITACSAAGGGVVYFPSTSTFYKVTQLSVPSNITLAGGGAASVIKNTTTNDSVIVNSDTVGGNSKIVIRDLQVIGAGATGSAFQKCIYLKKVTDCAISGCFVSNGYLQGIQADQATRVRIANNTVTGITAGNGISVDDNSVDVVIEGNTVASVWDSGIGTHNGSLRTVIVGNTITTTTTGYGIDVYGASETLIEANTIISPANHGIYIHTVTANAFIPERPMVVGNTIKSAGADGIQIFALADDQIHDSVIANNLIYDPVTEGIQVLNGVQRGAITGNVINAASNGIRGVHSGSGTPYRLNISGNYVRDCSAWGINLSANVSESIVAANYVGGNVSGGITMGTGNREVGNWDGTTLTYTGNQTFNSADLIVNTAGNGLKVKEGTNAKMGRSTLSGGTVTVSTTAVTASSEIFLTCQTPGGTPGFLRVSARVASTSFTILSSSGTDTSVVGWMIVEPA